MDNLYIPEGYKPLLDLKQTEIAIKDIKDFFQLNLSSELRLHRVTAPLFVEKGLGINDDLNGVELPVSFKIKEMGGCTAEIVQSLAKWKRMMLADLGINNGFGIYTDMNAIRPDEILDNIHSLYVDQWDWEKVITPEERNLEFLKETVRKIYGVLKRVEFYVYEHHPNIKPELPEEITFIHTEELLDRYPDLTPRERETEAVKEYGAIFIVGIGGFLVNGTIHDGRAPDYDDWSTPTTKDYKGLNGDIVVWNSVLNSSYELSSMGIRVDKNALLKQLEIRKLKEREKLFWHQRLINGEFPLSIGGGIGQSRLCMYYLRKAHIGEIQSSIWPKEMKKNCSANNIPLL